jgi:hypothetical protein
LRIPHAARERFRVMRMKIAVVLLARFQMSPRTNIEYLMHHSCLEMGMTAVCVVHIAPHSVKGKWHQNRRKEMQSVETFTGTASL